MTTATSPRPRASRRHARLHAEITVVAPERPGGSARRTRSRSTGRSCGGAQRLPVRQRHAHRLRAPAVTGGCSTACPTWWCPASTRRQHGRRHDYFGTVAAPPRASCSASRRSRSRSRRRPRNTSRRRDVAVDLVLRHAPSAAGRAAQRQRPRRAARRDLKGGRHAPGRRHKAENTVREEPARRDGLLGRRGRSRRRRGPRAPTSTPPKAPCRSTPLQIDLTHHDRMGEVGGWITLTRRPREERPMAPHPGIGMTSARTHARMVERAAQQGVRDEVVLGDARSRATVSSTRRSRSAPTTT